MIQVENIQKSFGTLQVLKGINLHIEKGKVASIVGASGAGKTTLLQILGTLASPDSGQILLNGQNPFLLSEKEKQAYDYLYLTSDRVRRARSDLVSYHDTSYALFWIRAAKETLKKAEEALKSNTLF